MKVYAVLNDNYYLDDDNPISGLFLYREDAVKHLIERAVQDFEKNDTPQEDRECCYDSDGRLWYICDGHRGYVGWYIRETQLR